MARNRTKPVVIEPRILREHGKYAIQVRANGKATRRSIGTLDEAREALRRFDATGYVPPIKSGGGQQQAPHRAVAGPPPARIPEPTPPEPPEPRERASPAPMDHLSTARTVLNTAKVQLEAELRQINAALVALSDEEDASAQFRQPGALASRITDAERQQLEAAGQPHPGAAPSPGASTSGSGYGKRKYDRETYAQMRAIVMEMASPTEPFTNSQARDRIVERLGVEVDKKIVTNLFASLRHAGKIRSEMLGNNRQNTVWYRTETADSGSAEPPAVD